ncbi:MAG: class I SAM-dependent methyltransferase [Candidatus Methanomethyliaceae archaeon]
MSCLFCSGRLLNRHIDGLRDRLGVSTAEWSFLRCGNCGSANLYPRPSQQEIRSFYPDTYSTGAVFPGGGIQTWLSKCAQVLLYDRIHNRQVRWIVRKTRLPRGSKVLDVGCGTGAHLKLFRDNGMHVTGVDFHEESVTYVRDVLKLDAIVGDVNSCLQQFGPNSVHMITAFHLIEHLLEPSAFVKACYDLLRPGGWLAGALPVANGILPVLFRGRWVNYREAPRHIGIPSPNGLRALMDNAKLEMRFIGRESLLNVAGMIALSLVPGSTTSTVTPNRFLQLMGGLVWALALPVVLLTETLGRPSVILFAAQKK